MYRKRSFSKLGILIIVFIILALLATGCGPKITSSEVVEKVRGLSELTTTKYTMGIVVSGEDKFEGFLHFLDLFGLSGEKMLLVAKGTVEAGVDLNQLQPTDVTVSGDGKTITLNLPPVMIRNRSNCLSNDPNDTYPYSSSKGLLTFNSDMLTELRGIANKAVVKAACEEGIMHQANTDAKAVIEQFLKTIMPTAKITVNSAKEPTMDECIGQ